MDNLEVHNFQSEPINKYIFEGKEIYIAIDIARSIGYSNPSKTVQRCIKARGLKKRVDYDVLKDERLQNFKKIFLVERGYQIGRVARVTIFYERAVYELMLYSDKEKAKEFQKIFSEHMKNTKLEVVNTNKINNYILNSEVERDEAFDELSEVLTLIENMYIIDDKSIKAKKCKKQLLNLSKYLIDKLQN